MAGDASFEHAAPRFDLVRRLGLEPPPSLDVLARLIESHTSPGDVVVDIGGSGGWTARVATDLGRRALSIEATPVHRLLAEVVLRPPDLADLDVAAQAIAASPRRDTNAATVGDRLRARFPLPAGMDAALVDELLALHSPRQLAGLDAILADIEGEDRAPDVVAALRLAFVHAVAAASGLGRGPDGTPVLSIRAGHVVAPERTPERELDPWSAFEDAVALVRELVRDLDRSTGAPSPVFGEDLRSLAEGTAHAVLRVVSAASYGALELEAEHLREQSVRTHVRLVLGRLPGTPSADELARAYHLTAWALGREAAASLPIEQPLDDVRPSSALAPRLAPALRAVERMIEPEGRVEILVDARPPEAGLAVAVAAAGVGLRVASVSRSGETSSILELVPPGSAALREVPRTRANIPLDPLPGGAGDPDVVPDDRLFAPPTRIVRAPFSAPDATRTVGEAVIDLIGSRGEPVPMDAVTGPAMVALDGAGHLRRLVRDMSPDGSESPDDAVALLAAIVRDGVESLVGRKLVAVEGDCWWLADRADREAAALPLADRVEWAVYSLLSTAGPLTEAALFDRVRRLFTGADVADDELIRACIDSYRGVTSTTDRVVTGDDIGRRSHEQGELIVALAELGHRLGFHVWIGRRQQARRIDGRPLGDLLTPFEREGPPSFGRTSGEAFADADVGWFRGARSALLWEIEWTAMLGETVLRRHERIVPDDRIVRFLVLVPERIELVRFKLDRSPILRDALRDAGWHVARADLIRSWAQRVDASLGDLEPLLGLDPSVDQDRHQADEASLVPG